MGRCDSVNPVVEIQMTFDSSKLMWCVWCVWVPVQVALQSEREAGSCIPAEVSLIPVQALQKFLEVQETDADIQQTAINDLAVDIVGMDIQLHVNVSKNMKRMVTGFTYDIG